MDEASPALSQAESAASDHEALGGADGSGEGIAEQHAEPPTEPVVEAAAEPGPNGEQAAPCAQVPEGTACIPGGWFERGLDEDPHACDQADQPRDGRSSIVPASRVWLSTFYMDVTEVTNAAYQACVAARECEPAGPLYRDFDADLQPISGPNWFQARAFCQWRGGGLPTDAQWEAAARGPDGEWYPWGNDEPTCELAVIMNEDGRSCGVQKRGSHPETGKVAEVCSRGPQRYGLCDMAGNAEEWVADWWSTDWATCGEDCAGADPLGPCGGDDTCSGHRERSIRGGSWYWPGEHAAGWHRRRYEPENDPAHHFGFRCALTAEQAAERVALELASGEDVADDGSGAVE